ncbi:MAG: alpha/beta hydrolase [Nanoarchaeota archaeon]|nr:alpha/beta hydrolase [Nanoarchaeota archaeon]
MNVIIIHGAYGNSNKNWFPWLRSELEKKGINVYVPDFPTPEDQSLENWAETFNEYEKYLDKDSIIIGHSLGVPFILSLLEKHRAKAAFLVAGFIELLDNPKFDEINKTFVEKEFKWNNIKGNCREFFIYNSDDDPYVPLEKGKKLSEKLEQELILVKGVKHFNEETGFTQFPLLLEDIEKLIQK